MAAVILPAVLPIRRRMGTARTPSLRIFPAIMLVATYWLAWLLARFLSPTVFVHHATLFWAPVVLSVGLLVWWLAFSRLRWFDRLWGVLALAISGGLAFCVLDKSLSRSLITQALPISVTAVVVWLAIAPRQGTWVLRGGMSLVSLVSWGGFLAWSVAITGNDLVPLRYNHPGLVVDLSVGLWAFPLPMDFDGDGDLDLVVSCPDRPSNGTYFFENPGGDPKMPVFKPGVRIGPGYHSLRVSHISGQPRVLTPAREFTDFLHERFNRPSNLPVPKNVNTPGHKIRANMWHYVDFDGDGNLDIVIGLDDWHDYGRDDGYDADGNWLRGPLRGFVYLVRNTATTDKPTYATPVKIEAAGRPVETFGWPSPNLADFDGDGDLDLLCGEFLDQFTYFQNIGTRRQPVYSAGQRLTHAGQPIAMDLQMIVPTAIDWDGDGDPDLIVGDEDGRVALVEHTGQVTNGLPQFLPPRYFQQQADLLKCGALATPVGIDWDSDGDDDLLSGNSAGYVQFYENLGPGDGGLPKWAAPVRLAAGGQTIRIQAGKNGSIQGPCEDKWGYTTLSVCDWNHDGTFDLVVNSIRGEVVWYEGTPSPTTDRGPDLKPAQPILVDWPGPTPKPTWSWWQPDGAQLVTQWRTTPVAIDYTGDGLRDLLMLDHEGYLALFERQRRGDGSLALLPGQRVLVDELGQTQRLNAKPRGHSGRRKLCCTDWDGDGQLDLLLNGTNAEWLHNLGIEGGCTVLKNEGPLARTWLNAHDTSPTTVDWNANHTPDLLIGAEDGHFYYLPR